MSEKSNSYEAAKEPRLFQVVLVPASVDFRRSVIVELLNGYVGTSEIIDEGLTTERLAFAGSTPHAVLMPTDEVWEKYRVVEGLVRTFGKDTPDMRSKVENLFPKEQ